MTTDRAAVMISKKHRDLLAELATAADCTQREFMEALIEMAADAEAVVIRQVFARLTGKLK